MIRYPHVALGKEYIREVLNGRVPICHSALMCFERHQNDLLKSKDKAYPFKFSEEKAERFIAFSELDWATAAQRRISDEYSRNKPNQRKIEKDQDKLNRYKAKITELRSTSRHQSGRQIAGIPAHHFMEKIQRAVTDSQEVIVVAEIQKTIVDYLNSR